MFNPLSMPRGAHPRANPCAAPIFGAPAPLIRMEDLTPEQAPWVTHPIFAWCAVEPQAIAMLRHIRMNEQPRIEPDALTRCMEEVLGNRWRREHIDDAFITRNLIAELQRHIMTWRWVALELVSATFSLVDWVDDERMPEGGAGRSTATDDSRPLPRHCNGSSNSSIANEKCACASQP